MNSILLFVSFFLLITIEETIAGLKCNTIAESNECKAKSGQFCLCPSARNQNSTIWKVPAKGTCPSIGCKLVSQFCYCNNENCVCILITCDETTCVSDMEQFGCYCYFGNWVLRTTYKPPGPYCSNLLSEIGNQNGSYQCSKIPCSCDQFGDCSCKPPMNNKPPNPISQNDSKASEKCRKRSFEFCLCESLPPYRDEYCE